LLSSFDRLLLFSDNLDRLIDYLIFLTDHRKNFWYPTSDLCRKYYLCPYEIADYNYVKVD